MKIVADQNIPWAAEAFAPFGDVHTMPGRSIGRENLADADALIVRSVTEVNEGLLAGTPVRFVGTATIGTDHVDTEYLDRAAICFASAAGSNANSVAEYVVAALLQLRAHGMCAVHGCRIGIIGVGDVGTRTARFAEVLGMKVVLYDPPRALRDSSFRSATLGELDACDVISLHVPLTHDTGHPTKGIVDKAFLHGLRPGCILINSARGGVVDSDAVLAVLRSGRLRAAVLDVWQGEPDVPRDLVEACTIATPHIAGYAADAKLRGTAMMADALANFTGSAARWDFSHLLPERAGMLRIEEGLDPLDAALHMVQAAYPIERDDHDLRLLLPLDDAARRAGFDNLRRNYPERREFEAFGFIARDPAIIAMLSGLGFVSLPDSGGEQA